MDSQKDRFDVNKHWVQEGEGLDIFGELLDLKHNSDKINLRNRLGVIESMTGVRVRENESIESAIRRFKKLCEKAGILAELRKREHYEKPSVKRKKKAIAAKKRALRRVRHSF